MKEINYEIPMKFNGYRVDRPKLWKIMSIADESYRFTVIEVEYGARFTFQWGKVIAVLMGLRNPSTDDPRYEPKLIQPK